MARKNPYLKKSNVQEEEFTVEQLQELRRCATDPVYFIKTYVKIQHPTRGAIKFKLYPYQEKMIRGFQENRRVIVLSARQTGKSVSSAAYLLWYAIFNFDKTILIASNKNENAMEMILRIQYAYENLPHWLKPGVEDDGWNKHSCRFDNGSRIESTATTETSGRGMAISLLYLDEFAFVQPSIQEKFWTSIQPTLSTGGSCIITSTPNGDSNLFASLWRGAEVEANGFLAIRVRWNEPPGRDEAWKQATIAELGERMWLQEFECEFLSSDALLISPVVLQQLTNKIDKTILEEIEGIKFFKEIETGGTYLIGIDPSTGNGNDFSVIEVFSFPGMEQMIEYRSNSMSSVYVYKILKSIIMHLEERQCTVYFSVENNGVGEGIISLFEADENPPVSSEFINESGKNRRGMTTTYRSKMRACLNLKEMVEKDTLVFHSGTLLTELKTFTRKGNAYEAQTGSSDDCISALLIVIRLLEEIAIYDQAAYDKLYAFEDDNILSGKTEEYDDHDEGVPFIT